MTPRPNRLLIGLLLVDGAFILMHLVHERTDLLHSSFFSIGRDGSAGEWFQYIKEVWILILLLELARRRANHLYRGWAFLFLYLLLDDFCRIHERLGSLVVAFCEIPRLCGVRARDCGEIIVSMLAGTVFLLLIGTQYYRSDQAGRRISHRLLGLIVLLALCGVVVDTIHGTVHGPALSPLLYIIEDGGEMLVMSVALWYVYGLTLRNDKADKSHQSPPLEAPL